ncbi:QRFP-like peptide receptor [Diadema antillarum]|uniref:QRFP-like peptide receptor n=1 Tax=Diadema antillarum TaxID=105358 RepID=UPI003A897AAD
MSTWALIEILLLVVYVTIILVGLLGNSLVIFSILRTLHRISFTSMMLCSLAIADLLFVAVFTPINLHASIHYEFIFGPFGCQILSFLWLLSPASSAMMLLVISAERYLVVVFPLQAKIFFTKRRGLFIVAITWLISFLLALVSVPFTKYNETIYGGHVYAECERDAGTIAGQNFKVGYFFIVLYLVPLLGMLFCNVRVIFTLHRSSRVTKNLQSVRALKGNGIKSADRSSMRMSCGDPEVSTVISQGGGVSEYTSGSKCLNEDEREKRSVKSRNNAQSTLQERKRVMLLLGILVVLYALFWGPLIVLMVVSRVAVIEYYTKEYLSIAFNMLAISNSAFNPIVYALMSRSFRQIIKAAFVLCSCRGRCARRRMRGISLRSYAFTSTRDRGSSMSNSRDGTQMTQYSMRSMNPESNKRTNGSNQQGYIYLRNNNAY